MNYPLAVAAKTFNKPSETFIKVHILELLPGHTALLARDEQPESAATAGPMLNNFHAREAKSNLHRNVGNARFLVRNGVRKILAEYGPVAVDTLPTLRLMMALRPELYTHFHGYDASSYLRQPRARKSYNRLFRFGTGYFAPSRFIANKIIDFGCPPDLMVVAPCGVDPDKFALSNRTPGKCLAVGRMVEKKSPLTTIRAFAAAARTLPDLSLDFVGGGEMFEEACVLVAELGMSGRITMHGARSHEFVRSLMKEASIFLQHSVEASTGDCEGLPVAILEAMSSGIPIVATRHSGIPEAVTNGEHGLLVNEHDQMGMTQAILELTALPEKVASSMARNARRRVEQEFTIKQSLTTLREAMGLLNVA